MICLDVIFERVFQGDDGGMWCADGRRWKGSEQRWCGDEIKSNDGFGNFHSASDEWISSHK